ncbi:MAG: hypothetical protein R3C04_02115 [Hyphomonas sp.]
MIAQSLEEADAEIEDMLSGKFGRMPPGNAAVIGRNSCMARKPAFSSSPMAKVRPGLPAAQDHKRVGDGDEAGTPMGWRLRAGAGGDARHHEPGEAQIAEPMLKGMSKGRYAVSGRALYRRNGHGGGAESRRSHARFGDPECQVLMKAEGRHCAGHSCCVDRRPCR